MYILGITGPISHNNAAVILKDGKLLAAAEEERFVGVKHSPRMPAINAIKYCLSYAGITLNEVDHFAVGYRTPISCAIRAFPENIKGLQFRRGVLELGAFTEYFIRLFDLRRSLSTMDKSSLEKKWTFIPHHLAHAASAYRASSFSKANILTLDGQGDNDSGMLGFGNNGDIKQIKKIGSLNSLGWFYSEGTGLLGFKPHSEEGKTMGLAPYGKPVFDMKKYIQISNGGFKLSRNWNSSFWKDFGPERKPNEEITEKHKNIAASVQNSLEMAGVSLAKELFKKTGITKFCLAGGTTLNCDMNSRILQLDFTEDIFIQPAAQDAGTALGAALELYSSLGYKNNFVMDHAYWGPEYSNDEIEKVLKESKLKYDEYDDIEGIVAEKLAEGNIIGWFQGRMEWGPRALGNRSILADPSIPNMKVKINNEVKHREVWRPFAPSILDRAGDEYFENYHPNQFMLLTFLTKEEKRKEIEAAIHVDYTARSQHVEKGTNPRFYKLIENFEKESSIPGVLNTSFNDKGQPIVRDPRQAIQTFYSTGLDYLAIGNFLLSKKLN